MNCTLFNPYESYNMDVGSIITSLILPLILGGEGATKDNEGG